MKARRVVLGVLGVLVVAPVLLAGGGLIWARSDSGQRWILGKVLDVGQPRVGRLEIGGLSTNLWSHLSLDGVAVLDAQGGEVVGLDHLEVDFSLSVMKRRVTIQRLDATGLRADVALTADGLDVSSMWTDPAAPPSPSSPYDGLGVDVSADAIHVLASRLTLFDGDHIWELMDVSLSGGLRFQGARILLMGLRLEAGSTNPDLGAVALAVDGAYDADTLQFEALDLAVGPQHLAISGGLSALSGEEPALAVSVAALHVEPQRLPWVMGVHGAFDGQGEISGWVSAPTVTLGLFTPGGQIDLAATLDQRPSRPRCTPRRWR